MNNPVYNSIGQSYNKYRRADPRITQAMVGLMGLPAGATIADIGAGTGNYSNALADEGYNVIAVEPSDTMMAQASPHANVKWTYGVAENIPLADGSVDGVVAVLTVHHFISQTKAITEMSRICPAGPIIWFVCDHREAKDPWFKDYFPSVWKPPFNQFPPVNELQRMLRQTSGRNAEIIAYELPWDTEDWFQAALWRRPEMYLDEDVRNCTSTFAILGNDEIDEGLERLRKDLDNGAWKTKYGHVLDKDEIDWGFRFLVVR